MTVPEFWLRDTKADINLRLPVTPSSFTIDNGIKVETVNITELGDINIAGGKALATYRLEGFIPRTPYPFSLSDTISPVVTPYQSYIYQFIVWSTSKAIVQLEITSTNVKVSTLIENVQYKEKDGSGDVYYTLTLRQHREIKQKPAASADKKQRTVAKKVAPKTYTVKKGDTLSAIAKKYYGSSSAYQKIYNANKKIIKNPNLIFPGQVLMMP